VCNKRCATRGVQQEQRRDECWSNRNVGNNTREKEAITEENNERGKKNKATESKRKTRKNKKTRSDIETKESDGGESKPRMDADKVGESLQIVRFEHSGQSNREQEDGDYVQCTVHRFGGGVYNREHAV